MIVVRFKVRCREPEWTVFEAQVADQPDTSPP